MTVWMHRWQETPVLNDRACAALYDVGLSKRTWKALMRYQLKTLAEVATLTERELRRIPNVGNIAVHEVKAALRTAGLALRP